MRNDIYAKMVIVVCAVTGCLTGFGINALLGIQQNKLAKDNTLLREEYDSVFFDEGKQPEAVTQTPLGINSPTPSPTATPTATPMATPVLPALSATAVPVPMALSPIATAIPTAVPEETIMVIPTQEPEPTVTATPSPTIPIPTTTPVPSETEVFTYPAQIFGQTPIVNRSDTYVTYFEFVMDLIETLEGEIRERNLSETALFTKFMLKALFCGIDISSIQINHPIPRDQAALAIHLAAEIMEKKGTDTTAKSAAKYVTDISSCSSAERKAIAYLYEQRIESGYQVEGQRFLPADSLQEKEEAEWMKRVRDCWK